MHYDLMHYENSDCTTTRCRPWFGDGASFATMVMLKKLSQFEPGGPVATLKYMIPVLGGWHPAATYVNKIYETHYGDPLAPDPLTLGRSAGTISHKAPSNLSKVDFYPGVEVIDLTLAAQMLDCWA
jgi:hypothetical protein